MKSDGAIDTGTECRGDISACALTRAKVLPVLQGLGIGMWVMMSMLVLCSCAGG